VEYQGSGGRPTALRVREALRPGGLAPAVQRLSPLAAPVLLYLASRLVTFTAMAIAAVVSEEYTFRDTLSRWDSPFYLQAATTGYPSSVPEVGGRATLSNIAFFPLFPALIRGVSRTTGLSPLRSGLLVATVAGLVATLLIWLLTVRLVDRPTADRAAALFCFFPGSFVATMVYAEPVMLALALWCILALLSRRWLIAGLAAALATASRPNAVALVPCCLWAAAAAIRERREWRAMVAPLLAPLGMVGFFAFLWARTGEPAAWFRVQRDGWGEKFDFGVNTIQRLISVVRHPLGDINMLLAALGLAFLVVSAIFLVRSKLPPVLLVYAAGIAVLAVGSQTISARPRFVWTAFPLFIALASRLRGVSYTLVVAVSAALLTGLAILSTATLAATP